MYKRYANPMDLIDNLEVDEITEYVKTLIEQLKEEDLYKEYLHRCIMLEGSFENFKKAFKKPEAYSNKTDEEIINQANKILNNFKPQ